MRDGGSSWAEIAKTFPLRTEGSVKKHWYKDMHYAEFAEDESAALMSAIKEYENNKWKVIGQKVGKPAKACEQYAKEHFPDLFNPAKRG
ncbi:MYB DNA-binding domain-containing protein [Diaporthe helianthi]|uniref:MYB DNA-binding domain-containing protein n=1 Tax=Diaporthe helianthi TaxID=158607 RepID=A0A2P5HUQ4_DIAHE|nr:MYB DNA-binding domain-containing protein [Diaporthe helianthi]